MKKILKCEVCRRSYQKGSNHPTTHIKPLFTQSIRPFKQTKGKQVKKMSNFLRIANLDRKDSTIYENKDYRGELADIDINITQLNKLISKESDWEIIGHREENDTEKGDAVFARLSKSGAAVTFYIGEQIYVINVQNIKDTTKHYIGISKPIDEAA